MRNFIAAAAISLVVSGCQKTSEDFLPVYGKIYSTHLEAQSPRRLSLYVLLENGALHPYKLNNVPDSLATEYFAGKCVEIKKDGSDLQVEDIKQINCASLKISLPETREANSARNNEVKS